ncbi:FtsK/SpoIIIE domain-containing protein [Micromonospora vinacea]|uniref:FtsK/SpoIIIE domain-containing protein n=1 Tax=Micromonospora vinacea TaxID=709878 RepID=UPI003D929877
MSKEQRLARAIVGLAETRIDNGARFIRVQEVATPMPLREMVALLASRGGVRVAVFSDHSDSGELAGVGVHVTRDVAVAIDWRNDSRVVEPIVIVGDLERNRAAGLADVPVITIDQIRRAIFDDAASDLEAHSAPLPVVKLLRACAGFKSFTDALSCADYCNSLAPLDDGGASNRARQELWRLGLLPDMHVGEIDARRLLANQTLVGKLRAMDATTRQRLIKGLGKDRSAGRSREYSPIRRFANTGDVRFLAQLDFEEVQDAFRSTQEGRKAVNKRSKEDNDDDGNLVALPKGGSYDERSFLKQLEEQVETGSSGESAVRAGEFKLDWELDNLEPLQPLMSDPGQDGGYESQSGSVEIKRADDPQEVPGRGDITWQSLGEIADKLRILEVTRGRRDVARCALLVDRLIGVRRSLLPYLSSIMTEGVRLFVLSSDLRKAAAELVSCWVSLWQELEGLRADLAPNDHVYLMRLAERLAICDLRLVQRGNDYTAYVLPLHPVVIEPRLRAAELFTSAPELPADFFDLVVGSLDPGLPSLSVPIDVSPMSLSYAGKYKGMPIYSRRPRQIDTVDTLRTLQVLIARFINVHPYATLSLSVGLLDPPVSTVKRLLRWLGDGVADRVSLQIYSSRRDEEELRSALDEASEELVSGEVSADSFTYQVINVRSLGELPALLREEEQLPHILFMFDVGEVSPAALGGDSTLPSLGSLISEWVFDTDPLEDSRPVIRPRAGSDQLTRLATAQAGLFSAQLPSQQRSPLLSGETEAAMSAVADLTTWVVLCEGVSALVPPAEIGELHLVGRLTSAHLASFVYSSQVTLLVEPVLSYLWKSTWLDPGSTSTVRFLLGSVRSAVPEGLLGFFKAQGALSKESVLGRLGFAAAIAFLSEDNSSNLVVSLDTDNARRWLGLREGPERRADLLSLRESGDGWTIEAIEVKSRSAAIKWAEALPEPVQEAMRQVNEMERLLRQIFRLAEGDAFTASRREILKRQVFLEALQTWESHRRMDPIDYGRRVERLNELFSGATPVEVRKRVFLVNPNQEGGAVERTAETEQGGVPVVSLGVPWLREALQAQPGVSIQIPAGLLDELGHDHEFEQDIRMLDDGAPSASTTSANGAASPALLEDEGAEVEQPAGQTQAKVSHEDVANLAERLQSALIARNAPFRRIETEQVVFGPGVVQIPFSVPAGAKLSGIQGQVQDISRDLGVQAIRIYNWPGHPGFAVAEIPRTRRDIPDILSVAELRPQSDYPTISLGAQLDFAPFWVPLDELPHLLVAGTTGSGKSVFVRSLLWQLTKSYSPDDLEIILIDAKGMADYLDFAAAPHFGPTGFHSGVAGALDVLADVIDRVLPERTVLFKGYAGEALQREVPVQIVNLRGLLQDAKKRGVKPPLKPLVIIIDEFAELVLGSVDRKRFENLVTRFVQVARAVGGHLLAATQRPSTDIVTGVMKGNFARVALRVQQSVDSRVILDENGAEALLGRGDMLFKSPDAGLVRLQGYAAIGPYNFQS